MNTNSQSPTGETPRPPELPGPETESDPEDHLRIPHPASGDAGSTFDDGRGRVFPCEQCGADLQFHIGVQSLKCDFCGHVQTIDLADDAAVVEQDYQEMLQRVQQWRKESHRAEAAESGDGDSAGCRELRCGSCGGNIEFVGTLTSTRCPYCDSPVQLEAAHKCEEERIPVDGVLPFQVDYERAHQNLKEWVRSRWFAPGDFLEQGVSGKLNGVYLSYFTYDSMTFSAYSGQRGEYYYVTVGTGKNKRRERRTRWYPASGSFQRFFDDVVVLANTGLRRDFMLNLEPWPLQLVVPFNQQMLAGFLARTYDMELEQCFGEAKTRIDAAIHTEVCQRIGGDTQQVHSIKSRYDAITFKHLLLPTWLMAYQYRNKSWQIFINAATGEVQGERPYSVWKILFAVVIGLAAAGAIFALTQS